MNPVDRELAVLALYAVTGWALGKAIVNEWTPALLRLLRRGRHERRAA
jgi:hypothetical protein